MNPDRFATDVLEFAPALRAFIGRRVEDRATADDLLQDVFVEVFRARGSLRDAGRLRAWLFQSTRAAVVDHYRRRRPLEPLSPDLPAEASAGDDADGAMSRAVQRFVLTLPEGYRRPLELVDLGGKSVKTAASELGLGESALKNRLMRGRVLLGKKLLACCRLDVDAHGRVLDYAPRHPPLRPAPPSGITFSLARGTTDEPEIRALLRGAGLMADDLTPAHFLTFLTARAGETLVGCVGGEVLDSQTLLLRSLAVDPTWRGHGIGDRLVGESARLAMQLGLFELYLLTETASPFFAARGYRIVGREDAPASVKGSTQFKELCPAYAVLMHRLATLGAA